MVEADLERLAEPAESRFMRAGTFVVIGGFGGVGGVVAQALAARGAPVVATARKVRQARAGSDHVTPYELDATDFAAVQACLEVAAQSDPGLAGVVNCAGSVFLKPAHLTTPQEWTDVVATNLTTAFSTVRAAGRVMTDGGSVVLCSSVAAALGLANHEAIAAAKGGIDGLVRAAAATYASRGLRFNAVAPGLVRTGATERITASERALEVSQSMHPLGRIGEPRDVASGILWLLDPANDWVTGQVIGIDGGFGCVRSGR